MEALTKDASPNQKPSRQYVMLNRQSLFNIIYIMRIVWRYEKMLEQKPGGLQ